VNDGETAGVSHLISLRKTTADASRSHGSWRCRCYHVWRIRHQDSYMWARHHRQSLGPQSSGRLDL